MRGWRCFPATHSGSHRLTHAAYSCLPRQPGVAATTTASPRGLDNDGKISSFPYYAKICGVYRVHAVSSGSGLAPGGTGADDRILAKLVPCKSPTPAAARKRVVIARSAATKH